MSNRRTHLVAGALVGSIGAALHPDFAGVPLGQKLLIGGSLGLPGHCCPISWNLRIRRTIEIWLTAPCRSASRRSWAS